MAGQVFYLKARDTLPIFEVVLKNPDDTVHDLTGTTGWKLHIRIGGTTTRLVRTMVKQGADTLGTLRYTFIATDWAVASSADTDGSFQVGGLVVGSHRIEYEVVGAGAARLTFPNDGFDTFQITTDVGQS